MGAALRFGGYRRPIIAIEHGALLATPSIPWPRRYLHRIGAIAGARANDAEVGVSDFMLSEMRRHPHARTLRRIYNGIDPLKHSSTASASRDSQDGALVIAFAGRLIAGKGANRLIEAVAQIHTQQPIKLLIAGEGTDRSRLESLAHSSGVGHGVNFVGQLDDMPAFWQACDVAVIPSETAESFSMTTLESMACAKPVLATHSGAIPELVVDGVTGTVVPPGDVSALTNALVTYAQQPNLRRAHGTAARARAITHFNINICARAYLDLFEELIRRSPRQVQRR
jgi:glycosyltransferase involved in cell wall biosynthesis